LAETEINAAKGVNMGTFSPETHSGTERLRDTAVEAQEEI
jgi:hypothetical protein